MSKSEFHITVGASMDLAVTGDVTAQAIHQLNLVKAALLYADQVTLCSPIAHMLLAFGRAPRFTTIQKIALMRLIYPTLSQDSSKNLAIESLLLQVEQIMAQKRVTTQQLIYRRQLISQIENMLSELTEKIAEMSHDYKVDEFDWLVQKGKLKIKTLGKSLNDVEIVAGTVQAAAHFQQILQSRSTRGEPLGLNEATYNEAMFVDFMTELTKAVKSNSS